MTGKPSFVSITCPDQRCWICACGTPARTIFRSTPKSSVHGLRTSVCPEFGSLINGSVQITGNTTEFAIDHFPDNDCLNLIDRSGARVPDRLSMIGSEFLLQSVQARVPDIGDVCGGMTRVSNCGAFPFDQSHAQAALFKQICACYSGDAGTDDEDVDRNVPIQRWEQFDFGRIEPLRFFLHYQLSRPRLRSAFNENFPSSPANVPIAWKINFGGQRRRFE